MNDDCGADFGDIRGFICFNLKVVKYAETFINRLLALFIMECESYIDLLPSSIQAVLYARFERKHEERLEYLMGEKTTLEEEFPDIRLVLQHEHLHEQITNRYKQTDYAKQKDLWKGLSGALLITGIYSSFDFFETDTYSTKAVVKDIQMQAQLVQDETIAGLTIGTFLGIAAATFGVLTYKLYSARKKDIEIIRKYEALHEYPRLCKNIAKTQTARTRCMFKQGFYR
jgi:hypothetical protein